MTFNVWTFLFEVLNFLVLAFVLHRLLYRPLRAAVDKRKSENERARTEAESARQEADTLRQKLSEKLAEADHERQEMLRKAAEEAEAEKSKRLTTAEAAAKALRDRAQHDAEQLRQDTLTSLECEIGTLAIGLAERILIQSCDASLNGQLIRRLIESVRSVTGEESERVRRNAGSGEAVIETSTGLDESTRNEVAAAVHALLERACDVKFEVNPSLVGGALMRVGGHVWDATLSAQLEAARVAVVGRR